MDYSGFLAAVDKGQIPSVALLHGAEPLLLDDAVTRVTSRLFADTADRSLAREVLEARDVGADAIVSAALTLPWATTHRLVIVKGADALGAKQGEPLVAYLDSPNPTTVLLLLATQSLLPSHWLMKAMPRGAVIAVAAPAGGQLVAWLRTRARADGFELEPDAAALLVDCCGDDLTRLRGEVEKAALAGGPDNRRVSVADVRAVVGEHRLRHIFDLTRALSACESGRALALAESLLNAGEEPLVVLTMLAREMRSAWQAAEALRLGRSGDEIARSLRRPPAAAAALIERARALGPSAAAELLRRCWDVERRLKLGGAARPELSLLIADLCAV